jgi:hypothetical protein
MSINKREIIPKGQSKMDKSLKLTTYGTQDEEKQNKNTRYVGHHYTLANTNNLKKK